jgi:hypothetical protein
MRNNSGVYGIHKGVSLKKPRKEKPLSQKKAINTSAQMRQLGVNQTKYKRSRGASKYYKN